MSQPGIPKRPYTECPDIAALQKEIEAHLHSHNEVSNKPMELVCFLYMMEHLSRVCRVIKSPGGNGLLVGVGGSGRQSCARLACFLADFSVFQIEIAKGYDMLAFREDMKKMLIQAGGNGEHTVFLFNDSQIKDEGFVEDINNLLNTGEIPNLYPQDKRVEIAEMVRAAARTEGKAPDGTPMQLFGYFIERCSNLLAIALAFSPIGDAWRARLRQFPSLVNCCTIDWFTEWPADALRNVAQKFLSTVEMPDSRREKCVEMCQLFHTSTFDLAERMMSSLKRRFYVTPTAFLELISTFKNLIGTQQKAVGDLRDKYTGGLDKLGTTEQSVEIMKEELIALQPQLVEKNKEVGEMKVIVTEQKGDAEKVAEVVGKEKAEADKQAAEANAMKEDVEADLAEAMPALEAAMEALNTLSKKDIDEVKALKKPPGAVRLVLQCVCILKGIKSVKGKDEDGKAFDDYWPNSTKMVADSGFLASLQTFDKDAIPAPVVKKIAALLPHDDLQPERVKSVSSACYGLIQWVRAMETYDRVAKVVEPKKKQLAIVLEEYGKVMEALAIKEAELKEVMDKVHGLEMKLAGLVAEQNNLAFQVDLCAKKLDRAENLITSLS